VKSGWKIKKLRDVLKLEYGKPLPKDKRDHNGAYPVYGANGIKCRTNKFYWNKPSVIVGRKGSAGEVTLTEDKFWPLDVTYFLDFDESQYDLMFLYHILKSLNLQSLAKGVKPGINRNNVYAIQCALPPLPEQKRIVAILDEVFAHITKAVANAKKNLTNARELFESYLNNVFTQKGDGWIEKRLDELTSKIGSGATPRGGKKSYKEKGISLIRSLNVYDHYFVDKKLAFINDEQAEKLSNVIVHEGDVLLNITGASISRSCVVPSEYLPARVNQHVAILRPVQSQILPYFLNYLIISREYKERLLFVGEKAGATRQALTKSQLQEFTVSLPCLDKQAKIVNSLDAFKKESSRLETIYQQKLTALAELKQSILQKAFSGELTSKATRSPDFSAIVLAFAYYRHATKKREKTFGRVKAQKILHLAESIGGIDLGRNPLKDAAGPNDFKHMLKAEEWAKENLLFEFREREKGYDFIKLSRYNDMKDKVLSTIRPYRKELEKVVDLLIPMNSQEAEVFATVHAAWNNLILDGQEFDDKKIIHEARDNWHSDKMTIPESKFRKAIRLIRDKGLVPDGRAKRVTGEERLL